MLIDVISSILLGNEKIFGIFEIFCVSKLYIIRIVIRLIWAITYFIYTADSLQHAFFHADETEYKFIRKATVTNTIPSDVVSINCNMTNDATCNK